MSKITWYIQNSEGSVAKEEYHAGTYRRNEEVILNIQAWNNRWGVEDAEDIVSPVLNFYFGNYEDSALLDLCEVVLNERETLPIAIVKGKGVAMIGRTLSGKANDGDENGAINANNFINIKFRIKTAGRELKENDLKRLYFDISELR